MTLVLLLTGAAESNAQTTIPINRKLEVVKARRGKHPYRGMYKQAGELLGDWNLEVAGIDIDGPKLIALAESSPGEPFLRVLREGLRRPFDKDDLLFFLDDVLLAGKKGLRGKMVHLLPGRARSAGVTIHPSEVFRPRRPRLYAERMQVLNIDKPPPQDKLPPAKDGDPLGPNWSARYLNPWTNEAKLKALAEKRPDSDFAKRVKSLIDQLEKQGCEVNLYTTVRNRHRGYLMWGSFVLSRQKSEASLARKARELSRLNHAWGLDVPIQWMHPGGWRATVEAARKMADAYPVVHATRRAAQRSKHYDGEAVDLTAVGLPRRLTLGAPDGAKKTFDLSGVHQTRDLNLTATLISWIERHFKMKKLKKDYPHWNDDALDPSR